MSQINQISEAKARLLLRKIQKALFNHEKGYFSGTLINQTTVQTRRKATANTLYSEIKELIEVEDLPVLSHYLLRPSIVIGKKGDQFIYPCWPLEEAIKHYCVKLQLEIRDVVTDPTVEIFQVNSLYLRSNEIYRMTSAEGYIREPDQDSFSSQFHEDYMKPLPPETKVHINSCDCFQCTNKNEK